MEDGIVHVTTKNREEVQIGSFTSRYSEIVESIDCYGGLRDE